MKLRTLVVLLVTLGISAPALAGSPWVPGEGNLSVSTFTTYQDFDSLYARTNRVRFPAKRMRQINSAVRFEYGITERIAADLTLGYAGTKSKVFGTVDGLDDTQLGVTFQLIDEFAYEQVWLPSAAIRVGGIIEGSYDALAFPAAPGDGASGWEVELSVGKTLPYGLGFSMTGGYRDRDEGVPADWHARVETFLTLLDRVTLSAAYDDRRSLSGFSLGDPDFDPTRQAPRLDEDVANVDVGLGYTDGAGRYWGVYYAWTVWGRNTGIKEIAGVQLSIPISLPWRDRGEAAERTAAPDALLAAR